MIFRALAVCVAAGVLFALSASARAAQSARRVTIDQAVSQLTEASHHAKSLHRGTVAVPRLLLLASSVPKLDVRETNAWLSGALTAINKERIAADQAQDLRSLAGSLKRLGAQTSVEPPNADPASVASRVLAERAYRDAGGGPAPPPTQTLWQRFLEFVGELFNKIFSGLFRATSSTPVVGQIVAILLVLLLAGVIGYAIVRLVRLFTSMRRSVVVDEGSPLPQGVDPNQVYEAAAAAARCGHYAQAIALLFQASLRSFDRLGLLPFDDSLTPSEYRKAVRRAKSSLSPYFDTISREFILAAFAEQPISQNDWTRADTAYADLRSALAI